MAKGVAESAGTAASNIANFFIKGANKAIEGINWITFDHHQIDC